MAQAKLCPWDNENIEKIPEVEVEAGFADLQMVNQVVMPADVARCLSMALGVADTVMQQAFQLDLSTDMRRMSANRPRPDSAKKAA